MLYEANSGGVHLSDTVLPAQGSDVASYKDQLEKRHTCYKVVEEAPQPDGPILVKILKQYNSAPVGDYLN